MTQLQGDPQQPPFDYATVTADAVREGCDEAVAACDAILDAIVAVPDGGRTFANTLRPLDEVGARLTLASGRFGFLGYVATDDDLRRTALEYEQRLDTYATSIGFREDVHAAVAAYAATDEARALEGVDARLLDRVLRDYRRNGFGLPPDRRGRVQELKERLVAIGVEFRRNIDEWDDGLLLTREELDGLPDSYIERLRSVETPEGPRYRVSLDYPEFYPFMESAHREDLRRELFLKNHNKAAELNMPLLVEAIAARDEIAPLLGTFSWSHYAIETKMAKTPEAVTAFLLQLERKVRVKANADLEELAALKRRDTGDDAARIEIWDWRYYAQRLLKERYEVDPFAVAEYFPLDATLDGMFALYQRLVGVRFVPVEAPRAWHPDVRLYRVEDAEDGHHIGHFYMDLHPRPDKYGHAAAFMLRAGRRLEDGSYEGGVSAIVANFTSPTADAPSLLRHSEVETLFHEFGHILHQVMT
ncbi:MAG: M3 family metallopeptidase, partial [Dehalococcoidia bacterium]